MDGASAAQPGQWLRDVRAESAGKVRVHLSPDWLVGLPVEVVVGGNPGYVRASMLGITDDLARDLEAFKAWWESHSSFDEDEDDDDDEGGAGVAADDPAWSRWRRDGWLLVERLQAELGPDYKVLWVGMDDAEE